MTNETISPKIQQPDQLIEAVSIPKIVGGLSEEGHKVRKVTISIEAVGEISSVSVDFNLGEQE